MEVQLRFSYCESTINAIKLYSGHQRRWDRDNKCWWIDSFIFYEFAEKIKKINPELSYNMLHGQRYEEIRAELKKKNEHDLININASKALYSDAIIPVPDGLAYMSFQKAGIIYGKDKTNILIGDEMGCVAGDMVVSIRRNKGTKKYKLREVYKKFKGLNNNKKYNWDINTPTYVRALCDEEFKPHLMKDILYKGIKKVLKLTLMSGKILILTPDHEVLTDRGWAEAQNLIKNDIVITIPLQDKVKSIEDAGETDVYDIVMTAPYHNFVANGVVVHNCGKTVEAIGTMNFDPQLSEKKILIVCPATLKINWQRELEKWLVCEKTIGIAQGSVLPDTDIVIINYDILNRHSVKLKKITWDFLIVDECHYLKNPKALRTKALLGTLDNKGKLQKKGIKAKKNIFMSGTPIVNRPYELWTIINYLMPNEFEHFYMYANKFCVREETRWGIKWNKGKNLKELQTLLRGNVMVRRLMVDALPQLPEKTRQVIELPAQGIKSIKEEQKLLKGALQNTNKTKTDDGFHDRVVDLSEADLTPEEMRVIARTRHDTALEKVPFVIEHLKNILEEIDKVVVFAHHHDVINAIAEEFKGEVVTLTGKTSATNKQKAVDDFQNNPDIKLFIGNIQAAGVGITLTASSHVIFAELDWVPGNVSQCENRCLRIGQKNNVLVQHLVLEGSIDAMMAKVVVEKQKTISKALDK